MFKSLIICTALFCFSLITNAQSDASRIVLNAVVLDKENKIPEETKSQLISKLNQIASDYGVGGKALSSRFVLAIKINILTKDIVAGPPQMIAENLEITFYVGDAIENTIFSSTSLNLKGVGTNENKAMIAALQNINIKNKQFEELINAGKDKIVAHFNNQCDFVIKKAETLRDKQEFDAAIYELMQVPEVCKVCYDRCMNAVQPIFQKKIDREAIQVINDAKNKWNANPNSKGAEEARLLLNKVEPASSSYKEAVALSESIRIKIEQNEKRDWDFKMKIYNDHVKLEEQRIEAARATAIEYYKNQPQTIIYQRLFW